jgi:hypothetical protein
MRAGWSAALEKRIRTDPRDAREFIEAEAVVNAHLRQKQDDWTEADSMSGLIADPDGGLRIAGSSTTLIQSITADGYLTDLDRASPFDVALVVWGDEDPQQIITSITLRLHPKRTAAAKEVDKWVVQLKRLVAYHDADPDYLQLQDISSPVVVDATGTAEGDFTFQFARPVQVGSPPTNPSGENPAFDPVTVVFLWAIDTDGAAAGNVGWANDSGVTELLSGDNRLSRRSLVLGSGDFQGWYSETGPVAGCPRIVVTAETLTAQTITFTTNDFDLGAAPGSADDARFVATANIPVGSSLTVQARVSAPDSWVTVLDGQSASDVGLAASQTYEMRATLTPDASGRFAPTLRGLGVREVTTTDLSDVAHVTDVSWGFDPLTLVGRISECRIVAVKDGDERFANAITDLLSTSDVGDITLRLGVGVGATGDAARDAALYFHIDDFLLDRSAGIPGGQELAGVSVVSLVKQKLPVYNTVTGKRQPLTYSNSTLKATYEALLETELGIAGRFMGPGVEDATNTVSKRIEESTLKHELDAICFLDGSALITSQGRLKAVKAFGDKAVVASFPTEEIEPGPVSPGFEQRVPEFNLLFGWDDDDEVFVDEKQYVTSASLTANLGAAHVDVEDLDEEISRWIPSNTIADIVGQRHVEAFGTGLILIPFASSVPHPELEPGDFVTVQTDRFVAKDPHTARAIKGNLWIAGVLVQMRGVWGTEFLLWVRSYADIGVSSNVVTREDYVYPEISSIVPNVDGTGQLTANIATTEAAAIRLAVSIIGEPDEVTVQAATLYPVDQFGMVATGVLTTLAAGQTAYLAAHAYENADGTGRESSLMRTARITRPTSQASSSEIDGWSATQDAAAPENGDVSLTDEGHDAYSNLEDANGVETTYYCFYDITVNTLGVDDFGRLMFYYNAGAGWVKFATRIYEGGDGTPTDEVVSVTATLPADSDLRVDLDFFGLTNPTTGLTVVMHGEDHATPGVQYEKVTSGALPVAEGGTSSITLEDKALLVGAATAAVASLAPGAAGNVPRSDGTDWLSAQLGFADLSGSLDHGALAGLGDDDHAQYHNNTRGDARYSQLGHVHDHGALTGLGDDDHAQYYNQVRGDARYSQLGHSHGGLVTNPMTAALDGGGYAISELGNVSLQNAKSFRIEDSLGAAKRVVQIDAGDDVYLGGIDGLTGTSYTYLYADGAQVVKLGAGLAELTGTFSVTGQITHTAELGGEVARLHESLRRLGQHGHWRRVEPVP